MFISFSFTIPSPSHLSLNSPSPSSSSPPTPPTHLSPPLNIPFHTFLGFYLSSFWFSFPTINYHTLFFSSLTIISFFTLLLFLVFFFLTLSLLYIPFFLYIFFVILIFFPFFPSALSPYFHNPFKLKSSFSPPSPPSIFPLLFTLLASSLNIFRFFPFSLSFFLPTYTSFLFHRLIHFPFYIFLHCLLFCFQLYFKFLFIFYLLLFLNSSSISTVYLSLHLLSAFHFPSSNYY